MVLRVVVFVPDNFGVEQLSRNLGEQPHSKISQVLAGSFG